MSDLDCSEIAIATLGVRDLVATRQFYESVFGYRVVDEGAVSPEAANAWRAPPACRGQYVVVGPPGARRGLMRLVAFDRPGEHIWGTYDRIQDYGHYAVNIRVPNIHTTWSRLCAAGARQKSPPTRWNVDESMVAWDSQCWDVDGTLLDVYQMEGRKDLFPDLNSDTATAIETVAIHVESADRSRAFYEGLGFTLFFDKTIENLGEFFHLPAGVALRDVNLYKIERSPIGRVEIVELVGYPGRRVQPRARPPNFGILSVSFITGDLDAARQVVLRFGGQVSTADYRTVVPVFGLARVCHAIGPDGEALEFVQPVG